MSKVSEIGWKFDNSYKLLPELFFSEIEPNPVEAAKLVVLNESLAEELGLNVEVLKGSDGLNVLAGNTIPEGGSGIAQAYADRKSVV